MNGFEKNLIRDATGSQAGLAKLDPIRAPTELVFFLWGAELGRPWRIPTKTARAPGL